MSARRLRYAPLYGTRAAATSARSPISGGELGRRRRTEAWGLLPTSGDGVSGEVVAEGEGGGVGLAAGAGLPPDVLVVPLDRAHAQAQGRGDRPVAPAGGDQAEHRHLARGQPGR